MILPKDNEKDLHGLPDAVRAEMSFFPVETVEAALAEALERTPERAQTQ